MGLIGKMGKKGLSARLSATSPPTVETDRQPAIATPAQAATGLPTTAVETSAAGEAATASMASSVGQAAATVGQVGQVAASTAGEPAEPCNVCGSLEWWVDPTAAWRCLACSPPRFAAQARRRAVLVTDGAGRRLVDTDPNFGPPIDLGADGVWFELLVGVPPGRRQWRREGHLYDMVVEWGDFPEPGTAERRPKRATTWNRDNGGDPRNASQRNDPK